MSKHQYFEGRIGHGTIFGRATSRSNFAAKTGAHPDYISFCVDPKRIALCDEAGDDRAVLLSKGQHEFRPTKIALARDAMAAVKAEMGGNAPVITIKKADDGSRHVMIDGEMRGRWYRSGTSWRLEDATGLTLDLRTHWSMRDTGLESYTYQQSAMRITMYAWDEAAALANSMQAWREDLLPPLVDQRAKAAKRNADHTAAMAANQVGKRAAKHAAALLDLLRDVAEGKPAAEDAAYLLRVLTSEAE